MTTLLIVLHTVFCVFLILVILLQTGKGAGMGAAFGGGSQTVFGPRGAGSFIGKLTAVVAALFMLTSIVLAKISSSQRTGIADRVAALNAVRADQVEEVKPGSTSEEFILEPDAAAAPADAGVGARPDGGAPGEPTAAADAGAAPRAGKAASGEPPGSAVPDAPKPKVKTDAPKGAVKTDAPKAEAKPAAQPTEDKPDAPEAEAEPTPRPDAPETE